VTSDPNDSYLSPDQAKGLEKGGWSSRKRERSEEGDLRRARKRPKASSDEDEEDLK